MSTNSCSFLGDFGDYLAIKWLNIRYCDGKGAKRALKGRQRGEKAQRTNL